MSADHPTEEEPCPFCGEADCEASCPAALVASDGAAEDDTLQPCGHPWSAVVWFDDETGDCGACLAEERRARGEEDTHAHEGP